MRIVNKAMDQWMGVLWNRKMGEVRVKGYSIFKNADFRDIWLYSISNKLWVPYLETDMEIYWNI